MKKATAWLLLILMVASFSPGKVWAQEPIRIASERLENDFPEKLLFHVEVEGQLRITKITLYYWIRGEDSPTVCPLQFDPGQHVQASWRWYTANSIIPPGAPIIYFWKVEDEAGHVLTTKEKTFYYDDIRFPWKTLGDDEVAVFWYAGGDDFGQELYRIASTSLRQLEGNLGARLDFPIRVLVYGDMDDFRTAFPPLKEWLGGMAFPSAGITVQIIEPEDYISMQYIVPHEISHLLFFQLTDNPYAVPPIWLDEGLAVYNECAVLSYASYYYDAQVAEAAAEDRLLPLSFIVGGFPTDREQAKLAYAQSYSLVKTLIEDYGWEKLGRYLQAYKEAGPRFNDREAFREVFGLFPRDFVNRWRAELGAAPEPEPTPFPTAVPFGIRTLPPISPSPTATMLPTVQPTKTSSPVEPTVSPSPWAFPCLGLVLLLPLIARLCNEVLRK